MYRMKRCHPQKNFDVQRVRITFLEASHLISYRNPSDYQIRIFQFPILHKF